MIVFYVQEEGSLYEMVVIVHSDGNLVDPKGFDGDEAILVDLVLMIVGVEVECEVECEIECEIEVHLKDDYRSSYD